MLSNGAFTKLLSIVDSADTILDFLADQNDAPMEFASSVTRGISDVLSTAAEQARMFDFFQLDPDEIQMLTQLATKHGAEDWRSYSKG
jgi:hypothetical protein